MTKRKSRKSNTLFGLDMKGLAKDMRQVIKEGTEMFKEMNELAGHAEKITENLAKASEGADDCKFEKVEVKHKAEPTNIDIKQDIKLSYKMALSIMKLKTESTPAEITARFRELQKKCETKADFIKLYSAYKKLMEKHKNFVIKGKPRVVNGP